MELEFENGETETIELYLHWFEFVTIINVTVDLVMCKMNKIHVTFN